MTREQIIENWGKITKPALEEFHLIAKNQPVFAGNLSSKEDAKLLMDLGFVMRYEGEYVLTDAGTELKRIMFDSANKIAKNGILNK